MQSQFRCRIVRTVADYKQNKNKTNRTVKIKQTRNKRLLIKAQSPHSMKLRLFIQVYTEALQSVDFMSMLV